MSIAVLVHAMTFVFLGLGFWLIFGSWTDWWWVFLGGMCLLLAWVLRPRIPMLPKESHTRSELPAFFELLDLVGARLGAKRVERVVVDGMFNATFHQIGLRQRPVVTIGLLLWEILDRRERVALLAHELAHGVNGDAARSLLVGSAVDSLAMWHYIIHPDELWPSGMGLTGMAMVPLNLVLLLIAKIPWALAYALIHLLWRDSQRAEYYADILAAQVAGSAAKRSMLDKIHYGATIAVVLRRYVLSRDRQQPLFELCRSALAAVPAREVERVRRAEVLTQARFDTTHPPTAYRVQVIQQRVTDEDILEVKPELWDAIERELQTLHGAVEKQLLSAYQRSLYH